MTFLKTVLIVPPLLALLGSVSHAVSGTNYSTGGTGLPVLGVARYGSATLGVVTVPKEWPTISGSPTTSAAVGLPYRFTPSVTGALSFSIVNKPSWASFDVTTGVLAGTPSSTDVGSYSGIVITARNAAGSASLPVFSISVSYPIEPTIYGTPANAVPVGNSYSFSPAAGSASFFTIANKPHWANFDPATGTLSGVPNVSDIGNYAGIVITAVSAANRTVSLPPFTITVAPSAALVVKVAGSSPRYFATIGEAYGVAATGASLKVQTGTLPETVLLGRSISVKLDGGKNISFLDSAAFTTIRGALKVSRGTLRVSKIKVRK